MAVVDGDILRGTGSFDMGRGTIMQQVFHYEYSGAGDTDDEIGNEITGHFTSVYTNVEARFDQMVLSEQVEVWKWNALLNQFDGIFQDPWLLIIGELVGAQMPNGVAALAKLLTNLPRRQGRKFVGGFGAALYSDAGWSAPTLVDMALLVADAVASTATLNGTLTPGVFNVVDESFQPFKNEGIVNVFANYQRRRRPGVGI